MEAIRSALLAAACAMAGMPAAAASGEGGISCSSPLMLPASMATASPPIHQDPGCLIDAAAAFPANARIIDLRSRAEYSRLHIPGAANQPLHSLLGAGTEPMIVYDGSRFRPDALQLCERLARYGVRDFKVIDGGIAAWAQSRRPDSALDLSRLSDAEASAAILAGTAAIVPLSEGFAPVLRTMDLPATHGHAGAGMQTVLLATPDNAHVRIAPRLARRSGQAPTLHWTGTPEQLARILEVRRAQDRRLRQGPMVDTGCPGL